jgi:hypothetical protein
MWTLQTSITSERNTKDRIRQVSPMIDVAAPAMSHVYVRLRKSKDY